MTRRALVTGATGNTGREVVRALLARGVPVRAAARSVEAVRALFGDEVEAVAFDFRDRATWRSAASGCASLFLLRPPPMSDVAETLNPFLDVARGEGIDQVVFLSVAGAERNRLVPHHAVEQHLKRRGGGWTILRPGFFAQNLQDAYLADIVQDDRIYVPAGRGRVAFVDLRDVAEVAAAALVEPAAHRGRGYTLTGPEAVTLAETAAVLGEALGRTIRYEPASVLGYVRHLRRRDAPWVAVLVQTLLHVGLRFGQAETVDPTLSELLEHPPRTIRDYVTAHASAWAR